MWCSNFSIDGGAVIHIRLFPVLSGNGIKFGANPRVSWSTSIMYSEHQFQLLLWLNFSQNISIQLLCESSHMIYIKHIYDIHIKTCKNILLQHNHTHRHKHRQPDAGYDNNIRRPKLASGKNVLQNHLDNVKIKLWYHIIFFKRQIDIFHRISWYWAQKYQIYIISQQMNI